MASSVRHVRNDDRFANHDSHGLPPPVLVAGDDNPSIPSEPVEITALQKMLSATSGSLLTGLLGVSLFSLKPRPPNRTLR